MATITVSSRALKQDDLVAIPREEYERLLRFSARPSKGKSLDECLAIARAEEGPIGLDETLDISLKEARAGKLYGPFKTARALMRSLTANR